jgi:hypothetical protein
MAWPAIFISSHHQASLASWLAGEGARFGPGRAAGELFRERCPAAPRPRPSFESFSLVPRPRFGPCRAEEISGDVLYGTGRRARRLAGSGSDGGRRGQPSRLRKAPRESVAGFANPAEPIGRDSGGAWPSART